LNKQEFIDWAKSFLLITEEHIEEFSLDGQTLEQAKMKFSDKHQALFEASWNLRKIHNHPVLNWYEEPGTVIVLADDYGSSDCKQVGPSGENVWNIIAPTANEIGRLNGSGFGSPIKDRTGWGWGIPTMYECLPKYINSYGNHKAKGSGFGIINIFSEVEMNFKTNGSGELETTSHSFKHDGSGIGLRLEENIEP